MRVSAMEKWRLIGALTGLVLLIIVILQNTEDVDTRILFVTVSMPRALLIFVSALLGAAVGIVAGMVLGKKKQQSA
jgi:putative membrane protein